MAVVQFPRPDMSSSTAPVSRLAELQSIFNTYLHPNEKPKTQPKALKEIDTNNNTNTTPKHISIRPDLTNNMHTAQARFQQKQLQEKEQKLLALYEQQTHQGYQKLPGPGGGKVRQLFQERRGQNHHPGWDRSYPLEPIQDNRRERGASLDRNLNNVWKQPVRRARSQARRENSDEFHSSRSYEPLDQIAFKYNSPVFGDENEYLSKVNDLESSSIFRKLPNIGGAPLSDSSDRFKTFITTKPSTTVTMAPAKEQKSQTRIPDVGSVTKTMSRLTPPSKKTEVKSSVTPAVNGRVKSTVTPPASGLKPRSNITSTTAGNKALPRPSSDTNASDNQGPDKMNRGGGHTPMRAPVSKAPPSAGASPKTPSQPLTKGPVPRGPPVGSRIDLAQCRNCGRSFAPDRVQAHTEICLKTSKKKRKPFDATKHRVQGTELEAYVRKGGRSTQAAAKSTKSKPLQPPIKSNWRRKHEEFIANIRAAKEAQAHVAKGGKLADLPPPPPMDTSDLIPCPHCNRKFNEAAAERHIPKCATMLHNKPKPGGPIKVTNKPATGRRF